MAHRAGPPGFNGFFLPHVYHSQNERIVTWGFLCPKPNLHPSDYTNIHQADQEMRKTGYGWTKRPLFPFWEMFVSLPVFLCLCFFE